MSTSILKHELNYTRSFPSSLHEVDSQVKAILLNFDEKYASYNRFVLDLVLRETLNNAVIHGNKHDPKLLVHLKIICNGFEAHVVVKDEGRGFHWRAAIQKETVQDNDHGRGFPIIHSYCTHVELNETGNQITFSLDISKT